MSVLEAKVSLRFLRSLQDRINVLCRNKAVDDAAQSFVHELYVTFHPSLVMARLYGTVPSASLPADVAAAAVRKAAQRGVAQPILPTTLVWTLLGTYGTELDWRDRRMSKQHVAIPLLSREFVETFPMVARLFKEIGVELSVDSSKADQMVLGQVMGASATRFFYVADAASATDHLGRRIIPGKDFVAEYGIKTVFGLGGQFATGTLVAVIFFSNETVSESVARQIAPVLSVFRSATTHSIFSGNLFANFPHRN